MFTFNASSSRWTPARDAYNGLADFPVSQTGVRELLRNQNFNRLSCRCTPVTSANHGASCGLRSSDVSPGSGQTSQYKRVSQD